MSRAARTARGAIGAAVATLLAAASHALAGGTISAIAVAITAVIALPICVALAGRSGSLWRVALGVTASQFMYHWAFAGIGVATSPAASAVSATGETALTAGPHTSHLASLQNFVPAIAAAGSADSVMWIMHTVAAVVSSALIARGERAIIALSRSLSRALPRPFTRTAVSGPGAIRFAVAAAPSLRGQLFLRSTRSLRGPPTAA